MLEPGDIVRLKEPFKPTGSDIAYTHGIVAEIVTTFHARTARARIGGENATILEHTSDLEKGCPRTVGLYLFRPNEGNKAVLRMDTGQIPMVSDFHIRELILVCKGRGLPEEKNINVAKVLGLYLCPECKADLEGENEIKHLVEKHGWSEEQAAVWWAMRG
jgi:hypothetical protein